MAVALATLPLKSLLAGDGECVFVATVACGRATGLAGALRSGAAGLATFPGAALGAGLATGFFAEPVLGAAFLTATLPGAGFFATTLPAAAFLTGAFLTGDFFTGAFFAAAFFAGDFVAATFLAGGAFFAEARTGALPAALDTAFFGAGFFEADFFGTALAAGFAAFWTTDLAARFTTRSLLAADFDLPAPVPDLADVLPLCALAAVELALIFAISLHPDWPWGPRVIADVFTTGKPASGILVPLHGACRSGTVNILTRLILWLLRLYKRWLSPLLGSRCRFHPTCSDYARIAVTRFGPWRGSLLAGWRLLRCQPLCDGGEDPVPEHFHYPRCRGGQASGDSHDGN